MTSGQSKQRAQLDSIEAQLLRRLLDRLPAVVSERSALFFTTDEFNPFALQVPSASQELAELAREALALRAALGEPAEGSVGHLFRATLAEFADVNNHHRLGPGRLAERLLSTLQERFVTSG